MRSVGQHALGLVAAPRLVPDRIGVVGGVVERRRLAAGRAGRIGDVPEHALRRREIVRQVGRLQTKRLGVGDVVFLARRRQRRKVLNGMDLIRIDAVCPEVLFVERVRQRDRAQRASQSLVLDRFRGRSSALLVKSGYRPASVDFNDNILLWLDLPQRSNHVGYALHDLPAQIGRQDDDGNGTVPQVLLRIDVLVAGNEDFETFTLRKP